MGGGGGGGSAAVLSVFFTGDAPIYEFVRLPQGQVKERCLLDVHPVRIVRFPSMDLVFRLVFFLLNHRLLACVQKWCFFSFCVSEWIFSGGKVLN